jgi:hypothetical protein
VDTVIEKTEDKIQNAVVTLEQIKHELKSSKREKEEQK